MRLVFITFVFLLNFSGVAFAQFDISGTVIIEAQPSYPAPDTEVEVSLETLNFDLNNSTIEWYVDSVLIAEGRGVRSITTTVGSAGQTTTVTAVITTPFGSTLQKSYSITPAEVTLVWEASTYTPPFYPGKTLRTSNAEVRFIALPSFVRDGVDIQSSDLIYTWKQGSRTIGSASGRGAHIFTVEDSGSFEELDVTVDVATPDGLLQASDRAIVGITEPELFLYERDSLLGTLYNRSVTDMFTSQQNEIIVRAEPYFFSIPVNALTYEWFIDGTNVSVNSPNIVFEKTNDSGTISDIEVQARSATSFLQEVQRQFRISFTSIGALQ